MKALLIGRRLGMAASLLGMTTRGDQIVDRTLSKVGGKGLFVKELELALESGAAHLAVHSLKDVPMELPEGFELVAVLDREDPRDAFVSNRYAGVDDLPQGALVGTSSLRRVAQLLAMRPDLRVAPLRGNLDTRLRKLDDGGYDAIVLAAAGLSRLGLADRIRARFTVDRMIPAAGQGALGLEIRSASTGIARPAGQRCATTGTLARSACGTRGGAGRLGGSCSMPLAAFAEPAEGGGIQHCTRRVFQARCGDRGRARRRRTRRRGGAPRPGCCGQAECTTSPGRCRARPRHSAGASRRR